MKIGAVIVSYNPTFNIIKLVENLKDVDYIVIIDNNSQNKSTIYELKKNKKSNLEIILNSDNYGIAKALNQGVQNLIDKVDWIMTLDQDSLPHEEMIYYLKKNIMNDNYGVISPQIFDLNIKKVIFEIREEFQEVDMCIQSGSLINIEVFKEVGIFNENLFMYYVDNEFFHRMIKKGFKIKRVREALLYHNDGELNKKFFFGKTFFYNKRSCLATYYRARNAVYMIKKTFFYYILDLIKDLIKIILFENDKKKYLYSYTNGLFHGIIGRYEKNKKGDNL